MGVVGVTTGHVCVTNYFEVHADLIWNAIDKSFASFNLHNHMHSRWYELTDQSNSYPY